jgi:hypothetical protein
MSPGKDGVHNYTRYIWDYGHPRQLPGNFTTLVGCEEITQQEAETVWQANLKGV